MTEHPVQKQPFGEYLRNLREARKLSQRRLADKAGVDFSYVSKLENDRVEHTPSVRTLLNLAKALDVDELDLMEAADKMPDTFGLYRRDPDALRFFRRASEVIQTPEGWRGLHAYLDRVDGEAGSQ